MSRGLGVAQKDVIDVLRASRGFVAFSELRSRFPRRARTRSLHRSIRSLRRRGLVREVASGGERWIFHCEPCPANPRTANPRTANPRTEESKADRRLLDPRTRGAGVRETHATAMSMLKMAAEARGLPPHAIRKIAGGADANDFKHLVFGKGHR